MYEHEFIGKIVEEVLKKITVGITLHVGDYLVGLEPKKQHLISLLNVGSDDTVHMELNNIDALELVRRNAFKNEKTDKVIGSGYEDVLERAVAYASGLPLALEVIEDMGKNIVKQESPNPWERSRLWASEDINEALKENKEKSKIGIIYVNNWINLERDGEAFNKMENLKTLLIDKRCHFDGSLKHLPNSLRVLDCRQYLGLGIRVVFPNKKFQNMRVLNFDFESLEDHLFPIHDLSNLPNLEELSIKNCWGKFTSDKPVCLSNLKILRFIRYRNVSVPPLNCPSLVELDLSYCYSLESFPSTVNGFAGNLKILRLKGCSKIRIIPLHMLHSLEELNLNDCTSLESFSHVVGMGEKLKTMSVIHCIKLRSIPPLKLTSLEEIDLSYCPGLESFPLVVDEFLGKLKTLLLDNCHNLKSIPPLKLDVLEKLDLSNCYMLESFPLVVGEFLGKLKTLRVKNCQNLKSIPPLKLDSLEILDLSDCTSLESFPLVVGKFLGKLKSLRVENCHNLKSIPPLKLDVLEELDFSCCFMLESFPLVVGEFLGKLKTLRVKNCHNLKSIPPLKLDVLEELDLSNCFMLESFPLVVGEFLGKLKTMRVKRCYNIKSIPPLKLDSLEILDLSDCTSLESFSVGVGEYLLKLETLLAPNCHNLRSMPRLKLDSLKKLDLSCCYSLESFQSAGNGLLGNIKFFNIEKCILLKSIPPLSVTSLQKFNISHCLSLESFPEISGEMRNIPTLHLYNISKKLLPLPLQNLTPAQTLYPCNCGIVNFPNRAAEVSSMLAESTIEGEGNVSLMKYSHVEYICLHNGKLSDEYWSISFMLFANMKELHLANNKFTVLPKSMEKCKFLWRLVLDDCMKLKEIKGIPPCLRVFSALNCQSLTSSSKSKLLNQRLHEVGNTCFRIHRANVPAWFDHQFSTGLPIPFWFRNKFPTIILCVYSPLTWDSKFRPKVIINGNTFSITYGLNMSKGTKSDTNHLILFHIQLENFNDKMDNALLQNKWNHAEVYFGISFFFSGIHVLKDKSRMEDIQFTNPHI
ncbi:hypothetical protein QL285_032155 [Trifolium repens]|nr:hypothetical protein QL285_032155 [Trifolium repens]